MNAPHHGLAGQLRKDTTEEVRPLQPALYDVGTALSDDLVEPPKSSRNCCGRVHAQVMERNAR
jgi:hypothetical protein